MLNKTMDAGLKQLSMRSDIACSVLQKAVKFDMPPYETAQFIQEIFDNLEWNTDYPYTIRNVIDLAKLQVCENIVDKDAYFLIEAPPPPPPRGGGGGGGGAVPIPTIWYLFNYLLAISL